MRPKTTYRRLRREGWQARLLNTLRQQPDAWWASVPRTLSDGAKRDGIVIYTDARTTQPVRIHLTPTLLTRAQCRYLQLLGIRVRRSLNRVLRRYAEDPAIQAVLPLSEDERAWMRQLSPAGFHDPATVFERFDTNLLVEDPDWLGRFRFLEINSVGVGCLNFMPAANNLIAEHVLPTFKPVLNGSECAVSADPRVLLRKLLESHAKAIGRKSCVTCFVERRETVVGGADEMRLMSEFLRSQGMTTVYADPRELELRNGDIAYKDTAIDLFYRDFTLSEIISIEKHGGQLPAMKRAFQQNRVISGLTGEFDHKSVMELLSSPEFGKYFSPSQRRTLQSCILWTRLMRERKTTDPDGNEVDLPAFVRANRERLVLKPNRGYGGTDVVLGPDATQAAWEEGIAKAFAQPDTCVVQEYVRLPEVEFIDSDAPKQSARESLTIGFTATPDGIAFLGRSCADRVVNITRGGSLVPVFTIK